MNCKVGDLAVVIISHCGNEGRFVTVIEPCITNDGPGWCCQGNAPLFGRNGYEGDTIGFPDQNLMPIRPPKKQDADEREKVLYGM